MGEPRVLTDEELKIGLETWHAEDQEPGSLAYFCALALLSAKDAREKLAVLQKALHDPDIVEIDIIEVYEDHKDGCVVCECDGEEEGRCPFAREVESTRSRPDACDHPKNEMKKVDGVWEGDCGSRGGRDVIPKHCPLRRKIMIIRLRQGT